MGILAPKPRHSRGPVITTPQDKIGGEVELQEEGKDPEEGFSCPEEEEVMLERSSLTQWRAVTDPVSCRGYYICLSESGGAGVRHTCHEGRLFDPQSETCELETLENRRRVCGEVVSSNKGDKHKKEQLVTEFIQFLIKSGIFNQNVVSSILRNK